MSRAEEFNEAEPKIRAIIYGLCHFHAIIMERKKFGAMGYNMMYPFGMGDLRDSAICLYNYMESAPSKIPWDDLRYIFGQIIFATPSGNARRPIRIPKSNKKSWI